MMTQVDIVSVFSKTVSRLHT